MYIEKSYSMIVNTMESRNFVVVIFLNIIVKGNTFVRLQDYKITELQDYVLGKKYVHSLMPLINAAFKGQLRNTLNTNGHFAKIKVVWFGIKETFRCTFYK